MKVLLKFHQWNLTCLKSFAENVQKLSVWHIANGNKESREKNEWNEIMLQQIKGRKYAKIPVKYFDSF